MGACNGYRYHELRDPAEYYVTMARLSRPTWTLAFTVSLRGGKEAARAWAEDEAMLRKIAAKPEVEELY